MGIGPLFYVLLGGLATGDQEKLGMGLRVQLDPEPEPETGNPDPEPPKHNLPKPKANPQTEAVTLMSTLADGS